MDRPIETARKGAVDLEGVDEWKIDQVVSKLGKDKVDVAALQETNWFGKEIYRVGKCVVLAAGKPVVGTRPVRQRGEEVAIIMSGAAVGAWEAGDRRWRAWSSRLMTATSKVAQENGSSSFLHVLSCANLCCQQGGEECLP